MKTTQYTISELSDLSGYSTRAMRERLGIMGVKVSSIRQDKKNSKRRENVYKLNDEQIKQICKITRNPKVETQKYIRFAPLDKSSFSVPYVEEKLRMAQYYWFSAIGLVDVPIPAIKASYTRIDCITKRIR